MEKRLTKIAIVSDDLENIKAIKLHLDFYQKNSGEKIVINIYKNDILFFNAYRKLIDIAIIDVESKYFSGLKLAEKLLLLDRHVKIILMGPETQAICGYTVDAVGYFLKPVDYNNVFMFLDKAMKIIANENISLFPISVNGGIIKRINLHELKYVEIFGHEIIYHLIYGKEYSYGVLHQVDEKLSPYGFIRCNKSCLLNVNHITEYSNGLIRIGDEKFTVTRSRKKIVEECLETAFGSLLF